ncbi:hypothetical protein HCN44_000412 [Aphidius gifuensis]|uniref:Uncharacterized protein n=1 Tax=Aphidius gifuensis TaxID=684658 RepID=A0A834XS07_APHGI|nr:hypothetical protein HCN44_000412 [Aphidius gifuensis]
MSNFQRREIRTLFWAERVPEFENRVYRQVIRLSRVKVTLADPRFVVPAQNLMAIALSVQNYRTVDILGSIPEDPVDNLPAVPLAELRDVGNMTGPIQITAFIRYKIVHQVVGNFSYGSGAITDGIHHLCVNVAGMHGESPEPGTHVSLTVELRYNAFNTLILQITDMSNIRIVDNQIMDQKSSKNGFRKIPKLAPQAIAQQQQVTAQIHASPAVAQINPMMYQTNQAAVPAMKSPTPEHGHQQVYQGNQAQAVVKQPITQQQIPQRSIAQVYAPPTVQQHQRALAQPGFQQIHQQQQVTAQIHASPSVAQINRMMYQINQTAIPALQSPSQNQPIFQQQEGGNIQVKDQAVSSFTVPDHGDQQVYQEPFIRNLNILQTKKISKPTLQSNGDESDGSGTNDIQGESIVIEDNESESEIEGSPKRQRIR